MELFLLFYFSSLSISFLRFHIPDLSYFFPLLTVIFFFLHKIVVYLYMKILEIRQGSNIL